MEEQVDILNPEGQALGYSKGKNEAHALGLWHSSAHIWLYNKNGEVLLQKRSANKDTFPSLWDISSAGHISAGETPIEGALRELYEEIGVKAKANDLEFVTKLKVDFFYQPKRWHNREIAFVYLLEYNKNNFVMQKSEVDELKFFPLEDFLKMSLPEREIMVPHQNYYNFIASEILERLNTNKKINE